MEFVRKIIFIVGLFFPVVIFAGCASNPIIVTTNDPLVLEEVVPLLMGVGPTKEKTIYEPVYGIMRIQEITQKNGVQVEVIAKKGDIKEGLSIGVTGEIATDASFGEIIGTFTITSIANGFVTGKIENVTKKIPKNAYMRVVIGQKLKEEE